MHLEEKLRKSPSQQNKVCNFKSGSVYTSSTLDKTESFTASFASKFQICENFMSTKIRVLELTDRKRRDSDCDLNDIVSVPGIN